MKSLTAQIAKELKKDILTGCFKDGKKLKLTDLKERYQVGMSPVREALYGLSLSGLVKNEAQKGFYVAPLSLSDLEDLYRVRILTDTEALRLSCEKGDAKWEENIITTYHQLEHAENKTTPIDAEQWEALHRNFHYSLIAGCDSPHLLNLFNLYYDQALRYRLHWLQQYKTHNNNLKKHNNEHKKLMQATLNRDVRLAINLLEQHYHKIVKTVGKSL